MKCKYCGKTENLVTFKRKINEVSTTCSICLDCKKRISSHKCLKHIYEFNCNKCGKDFTSVTPRKDICYDCSIKKLENEIKKRKNIIKKYKKIKTNLEKNV